MKIWTSYGSEHSANLVIIGKFDSAAAATEAEKVIHDAIQIATNHPGTPAKFSQQMMDFLVKENLMSMGYNDADQLQYETTVKRDGDKVVITTEEIDVQAFIKILFHKSARIEMYSAHDFPTTPYGRGKP